jgi:hypothetical protein
MSYTTIIEAGVKKIVTAEKAGVQSTGSLLIDLLQSVAECVNAKEVAAKAAGLKLAKEYDKAQGDMYGRLRSPEPSKEVTTRVIATVRVGEKKWFKGFFVLLAEMHKRKPLSYSMLRHIGGRASKLKDAPSLAWCEKTRIDILAGKRTNTGKRNRKVAASTRLNAIADALGDISKWQAQLPKTAHAHIARMVTELDTVMDMWNASVKAEKEDDA